LNLEILNRGNEPAFVIRNRSEVIDITLSSTAIWHDIFDRNPQSTDGARYKNKLISGLGEWDSDVRTIYDIELNVNLLQTQIIVAYESSCPLRTVKPGQNTPYWSSDLTNFRNVARRAWSHWEHDPNGYRDAVREYSIANW
jgi:hypothetical protein